MGPKNVLYLAANFYKSMCNALLQFSIIFVQAPQSSNQTKKLEKVLSSLSVHAKE